MVDTNRISTAHKGLEAAIVAWVFRSGLQALATIVVLLSLNFCLIRAQVPFTQVRSFTLDTDSAFCWSHGDVESFCYGNGSFWLLTDKSSLLRVDTIGTICEVFDLSAGNQIVSGRKAICFFSDTIWICKDSVLYSVSVTGTVLARTISLAKLPDGFKREQLGMARNERGFWLLDPWLPHLYHISEKAEILQSHVNNLYGFWSPGIALLGNTIFKIGDNSNPKGDALSRNVMAINTGTGDIEGEWDWPYRDPTPIGLTLAGQHLWSLQSEWRGKGRRYTLRQLNTPQSYSFIEDSIATWGDFLVTGWSYAPIQPSQVEGTYALGMDPVHHALWIGDGVGDTYIVREKGSRTLALDRDELHWGDLQRPYDYDFSEGSLWLVHYWEGWLPSNIVRMSYSADSLGSISEKWPLGMSRVNGIAVGPDCIWISGIDSASGTWDRNRNLRKYDRSGHLLARITLPDDNRSNIQDLAWFRGSVWAVSCSTPFEDSVWIHRINSDNGTIEETYDTGWKVSPSANVQATLAADSTQLYMLGTTATSTFDRQREILRILHLQPLDKPAAVTLRAPADKDTVLSAPVNLIWHTAMAAETYHVQVSEFPSFSSLSTDLAGIADTIVRLTAPRPGARHYWRVRAENGRGAGDWSSTWSFILQPARTPELEVDRDTLEFGSVQVGSDLRSVLRLTNAGDTTLNILAMEFISGDSNNFHVEFFTSVIAVGGFFDVGISFLPKTAGPKTALLRIRSNDPRTPDRIVVLKGTGVDAPPRLFIETTQLDFAHVPLGMKRDSTAWIENRGGSVLRITNVHIVGKDSSSFAFLGPDSSSIAPGARTSFPVSFNPIISGSCSADLSFETNDILAASVRILLLGNSTTQVDAMPFDSKSSFSLSPIFPNPMLQTGSSLLHGPSHGVLTVRILDVNAREIQRWDIHSSSPDANIINLDGRNLKPGVYTLLVESERGTAHRQFIVLR